MNITMNGYNGDSIKKNTSLWIMIGDCRFETSEEKPDSLLYVPILETVRYGEEYLLFYGEMIIGCNLSYTIATHLVTDLLLLTARLDQLHSRVSTLSALMGQRL